MLTHPTDGVCVSPQLHKELLHHVTDECDGVMVVAPTWDVESEAIVSGIKELFLKTDLLASTVQAQITNHMALECSPPPMIYIEQEITTFFMWKQRAPRDRLEAEAPCRLPRRVASQDFHVKIRMRCATTPRARTQPAFHRQKTRNTPYRLRRCG